MISNNPPPEATFSMAIDDLYEEAKNFIDGTPVETQGQADTIGKIVSELKQIAKAADAVRVITAANKPLTAFLLRQEQERQEEANRLAEQARIAAIEADKARANIASLDDAERADELAKEASKLDKSAKRTDKAKSHVASVGRAIGLRTYWIASVTDFGALLSYMKKARPDDLKAMLSEYAKSQVSVGARHIPGVLIEQEKRAA